MPWPKPNGRGPLCQAEAEGRKAGFPGTCRLIAIRAKQYKLLDAYGNEKSLLLPYGQQRWSVNLQPMATKSRCCCHMGNYVA